MKILMLAPNWCLVCLPRLRTLLRVILLTGFLAGCIVFPGCAGKSGGPVIEPVNKTSDGVAIKGYDPVAYFVDGKPVKGNSGFEYVWTGAKWYFSSAEHRDLFIGNPEILKKPMRTGQI